MGKKGKEKQQHCELHKGCTPIPGGVPGRAGWGWQEPEGHWVRFSNPNHSGMVP